MPLACPVELHVFCYLAGNGNPPRDKPVASFPTFHAKPFTIEDQSSMSNETIEGYRLSPQQERIWTLQQRDSEIFYQASCAILIEGRLELTKLKAALEEVSRRHEILRTTFHSLPEMKVPVQVISPAAVLRLPEHDLRRMDAP